MHYVFHFQLIVLISNKEMLKPDDRFCCMYRGLTGQHQHESKFHSLKMGTVQKAILLEE